MSTKFSDKLAISASRRGLSWGQAQTVFQELEACARLAQKTVKLRCVLVQNCGIGEGVDCLITARREETIFWTQGGTTNKNPQPGNHIFHSRDVRQHYTKQGKPQFADICRTSHPTCLVILQSQGHEEPSCMNSLNNPPPSMPLSRLPSAATNLTIDAGHGALVATNQATQPVKNSTKQSTLSLKA